MVEQLLGGVIGTESAGRVLEYLHLIVIQYTHPCLTFNKSCVFLWQPAERLPNTKTTCSQPTQLQSAF